MGVCAGVSMGVGTGVCVGVGTDMGVGANLVVPMERGLLYGTNLISFKSIFDY